MNLGAIVIMILLIILIVLLYNHVYFVSVTQSAQVPQCENDPYGCCPNTQIPKLNAVGSNCMPN